MTGDIESADKITRNAFWPIFLVLFLIVAIVIYFVIGNMLSGAAEELKEGVPVPENNASDSVMGVELPDAEFSSTAQLILFVKNHFPATSVL